MRSPLADDISRLCLEIGERARTVSRMMADIEQTVATSYELIAESRLLLAQADAILARNGK
jgi:hypothetical protein